MAAVIVYGGPSESVRAFLRGAQLTEEQLTEAPATWRSRKPRHSSSASNLPWCVQRKHAHTGGGAIRTKAILSLGQRSINLAKSS